MKPNQVNFWWRRIIFSPNRIAVLICSLVIFCLLTDTYARTWGDDFNDGNLDGWAEEHDPNTTWQVKDGVLDVTAKSGLRELRRTYELEFTVFPIEAERLRVRFTILDETEGSIGLLIGKQPDFGSLWRRSYKFTTGGIWPPIVFPNRSPNIRYEINKNQNIEIAFDKGHFRLLSMGKQILEFKDDNFKTISLIAIAVVTGEGRNFHAVLDNFVISGPTIPQGPPFPVDSGGKLAISWGQLKTRG